MVDDVDVRDVENESVNSPIPPANPPSSQIPLFLSLPEVITHILPSVTLATLRWWVHIDYEGFNTECVTRRGKRVFVIRDNFLAWMLKGQKGEKEREGESKDERKEENGRKEELGKETLDTVNEWCPECKSQLLASIPTETMKCPKCSYKRKMSLNDVRWIMSNPIRHEMSIVVESGS